MLRHIELPLPVSFIGVPIVGAAASGWRTPGSAWTGCSAPSRSRLIFVLDADRRELDRAYGITPTGSLSKIPQFTFGAIAPAPTPT